MEQQNIETPATAPAKVLVVYYSDTGTTEDVAKTAATALNATIERIKLARPISYWKKALQAMFGCKAAIKEEWYNPNHFDVVIVATPVWCWHVSSPVRTWLTRNGAEIKNLAVIITCGGAGTKKTLANIEHLSKQKAVAHVAMTEQDRKQGKTDGMMADFVDAVQETFVIAEQK